MDFLELEKLFEVFEFAKGAHEGQLRKTGESYMTHPIEVAKIAKKYGADDETIYACLLHDVVEDTGVSLEEIKREFGKEVSLLVDGVTKIEGDKASTLQKVWDYSVYDRRVALIKIADRIHNVSHPLDSDKWREQYKKSTDFYIGLGKDLGGFEEIVNELKSWRDKL